MLDHLFVFAAVFVLDCAFAAYVVATATKSAWPAAVWAAVIMGINGYLAVIWTSNPATIPAAMLGAAVGTWACIRWLQRG